MKVVGGKAHLPAANSRRRRSIAVVPLLVGATDQLRLHRGSHVRSADAVVELQHNCSIDSSSSTVQSQSYSSNLTKILFLTSFLNITEFESSRDYRISDVAVCSEYLN